MRALASASRSTNLRFPQLGLEIWGDMGRYSASGAARRSTHLGQHGRDRPVPLARVPNVDGAVAPARRDLGRPGALQPAAPVDAVDDGLVALQRKERLLQPLQVPEGDAARKVAGREVALRDGRCAKRPALERLWTLKLRLRPARARRSGALAGGGRVGGRGGGTCSSMSPAVREYTWMSPVCRAGVPSETNRAEHGTHLVS